MNRVYKIVWSKAKNAYVVTSELAKNHTKSASGKAVKAALTAAVGMGVLMGGYAADAAAKDIVDKGGNPIAYDISPENDGTNIAIGKNAKVFIGGGTQESMLSFGETVDPTYWHGIIRTGWNIHSNTDAKKNLPAGMSVGKNTYARTGSIQIGDHTLEKNQIAIGDTTADKLRQFGVASTTLGTNSYTGGGFATTIGSYNVQSSQYEAANSSDTLSNSTKNAFSTVVGTLNSNESMTGSSSSGVSNMISGVANKVTNSNGAIVMGAGNSIKNSSAAFDTSAYSTPYNSVATMQKALMDGVARSAGGSTLAIGGANAAEYTQASQLIGVGNTLTGKSGNVSKYNMLDGYKNKASNVQHVSVIGSENNVTNTNGAVVFGDKRTLTGADGSIVIGSSANGTATSVKNAIAIGSETNVTVAGGVALGSSSVASVDKGAVGYDASGTNHNSDTTGVWKSTAAAVSVGDAAGNTKVTRQITNVAAGKEDTDAVNVAQLKTARSESLNNLVIPAFEKETGIKVNVIVAGTGPLVKRVASEKDNPQGDILWAADQTMLDSQKELFEKYVSPEDANMIDAAKNKTGYFSPAFADPTVFIVNKKLAGDMKIAGFDDLLNPALKGKIACGDPANSSSAFQVLMAMLYAKGKDGDPMSPEAWAYVDNFIKNVDGKFLNSSGAVHKGAADGEYTVGLTWEDPAATYVKNGADVEVVFPKEGAIFPGESVQIIKGAKHMENAKKFVDFMLSQKIQEAAGKTLTVRPLRKGVKLADYMTPQDTIALFKNYDEGWVAAHKKEVVAEWNKHLENSRQ